MTTINKISQGTTQNPTTDELLKTANLFLAKNDFSNAYQYIAQLLDKQYGDAQFLITAGLVALAIDKTNEAENHFNDCLKLDPENKTASYNLGLISINENDYIKAKEIFENLLKKDPGNASLLNDMGVVYSNLGNIKEAITSFEKAIKIDPNLKEAKTNITKLKSNSTKQKLRKIKGIKIAFFANHTSFLNNIIEDISQNNETRLFEGETTDQMTELMEWADLAWFEWCDNLVIEASNLPKKCNIICRIHSYEVFTDMPSKVNWGNVDHILFVNETVKELFERQVDCKTPRSVISNGVDTNKFNIPSGKKYGKKIASVGFINDKKNPTLLLYCFKKIHQYDPEYSLHIAGEFQDPRIQLYFENFILKNKLPVYFDSWVEDMPSWYADKDFVISTSLFESFHYSIVEGMTSGLMPLIHDWKGSDLIYPYEYLYNDPDECLDLLKKFESDNLHNRAIDNRQFICDRYMINDKLAEISNLLAQLTAVGNIWQNQKQGQ